MPKFSVLRKLLESQTAPSLTIVPHIPPQLFETEVIGQNFFPIHTVREKLKNCLVQQYKEIKSARPFHRVQITTLKTEKILIKIIDLYPTLTG